MQTSISQTVALTMNGNAAVQGRRVDPFWPDASVFKFCRSVRFAEAPAAGRAAPVILAETPDAWLDRLREDATGVRLRLLARNESPLPDRMSVGFVGGGSRWIIETLHRDAAPQLWQEAWQPGDRDAPDRRIWEVVYWRLAGALPPPADREPGEVEEDLRAALLAIADFAARCGSGFVRNFRTALAALEGAPVDIWHRDLAPAGFLPPSAERLLAVGQVGWVFGGMGSWNDGEYGGDDSEEGDRLSNRLFDLLQEGLVVAANSTCPASGG
jgi:hypothetical protein